MSKLEKLEKRICSNPKDFTYQELTTLLKAKGFEEQKGSGSARRFVNEETGQIIRLHQPHPGNIVKTYIIKEVINVLGIC